MSFDTGIVSGREVFVMLSVTGSSTRRLCDRGENNGTSQRDGPDPIRAPSLDPSRCSLGDSRPSRSGAAAGVKPAPTRLQCRAEIFDAPAPEAGAGDDLDDRLPLSQQLHRLDNLRRHWRLPSLVPVFLQVVIVPHVVRRRLGLTFGGGDLIGQRRRVPQCQRRLAPGLAPQKPADSVLALARCRPRARQKFPARSCLACGRRGSQPCDPAREGAPACG